MLHYQFDLSYFRPVSYIVLCSSVSWDSFSDPPVPRPGAELNATIVYGELPSTLHQILI